MTSASPALADIARASWDAVILGAGPCGSVAARELALRGLRTLLIDRSRFPRFKVCGGCLAPGGVEALRRLGLDHILADAPRFDRLVVCASGRSASTRTGPMRGVDRAHLDHSLALAAIDAGCTMLDGVLTRVEPDERVRLSRDDEIVHINPAALIVADGLKGNSLRALREFDWQIRRRSKIGLGGLAGHSPGLDADSILMCVGRTGYIGFAGVQGGQTAIAAAIHPNALVKPGGVRRVLEDLMIESGAPVRLPNDLTLRGTPQLTRRRRRVEAGRILVAGDAAAYIEPFTGEGMTWALRSGELVACFAQRLVERRLEAGSWTRTLRAEFTWARRRCLLVSAILDRPPMLRASMALTRRCPSVAADISRAFGRLPQERLA